MPTKSKTNKNNSTKKEVNKKPAAKTISKAQKASTLKTKQTVKNIKSLPETKKAINKLSLNFPSSFSVPNIRAELRKPKVYIPVLVLLLLGLFYLTKGLFIAATVNGSIITRFSVISQLEQTGGKQVLSMMIQDKLIQQEAAKRHIRISDSEVNAQISKIKLSVERQGQSFTDALASQGYTEATFQDQVKDTLLLNKIVGTPTVTSKEISDYIAQNKSQLQGSASQQQEQAKQQLIQQKQQQEEQQLLQTLQSQAHINYFVNY